MPGHEYNNNYCIVCNVILGQVTLSQQGLHHFTGFSPLHSQTGIFLARLIISILMFLLLLVSLTFNIYSSDKKGNILRLYD